MNPAYLEDASGYKGHAEALFVPATEAELQGVLREANSKRIPVTIAGAGTGLTGARVAQGGWVVSTEKFRDIDIGLRQARVGAGVLLKDLQAAAAPSGQFYAPDPTESGASLGGTVACNASGSRSFRCRDTRRHVLGLRVVTMDGAVHAYRRGEAIDFDTVALPRPQTTKHSAGFLLHPGMDWLDLFIGSEGTLGVVTEATVRLVKTPGEILAGVIFFPSDADALRAVEAWRPIPGLRMLEYFDAGSLELLRQKNDGIPKQALAALLVEQEIVDESEMDAWEQRLEVSRALAEDSWFASTDRERERFRKFRHGLPEAVNSTIRQRGLQKMGTDFAVPVSENAAMMAHYRHRLEAEFPGQYVIFGHIGDAHVHVNILPADGVEAERAKALMVELARKAVSLGGTVGAEHGLGKRKAHLLAIQYSPAEIEAMKAVKRRLDPHWLLGQGTLFERG
ncbi:MAG: FAD-binding oxidoreductase [Bryobacteraceae bacterium]